MNTLNIIRFLNEKNEIVLGLLEQEKVYNLSNYLEGHTHDLISINEMAKKEKQTLATFIESLPYKNNPVVYDYNQLELVSPIESPEVWACGVTYENSRIARNLEMEDKAKGSLSIYDKVYDAIRPEIFFKSTGARTVPPNWNCYRKIPRCNYTNYP